jgi:hypothetical protein
MALKEVLRDDEVRLDSELTFLICDGRRARERQSRDDS